MSIEDAIKNEPKKPLNAYFRFQTAEYKKMDKDEKGKRDKVKEAWDNIDSKEKKKLEEEYAEDKEDYKKEYEEWLDKYGISESDVKEYKKKKRSKAKNDDSDDDRRRSKTKGKSTKDRSAKKYRSAKKDRSAKRDRSKSRSASKKGKKK